MVEQSLNWLTGLPPLALYFALAVFAAVENIFPPIPADTVVLCAGQLSDRSLADTLATRGITAHVIGGADVAAELDAKRAIDQGTRLAATL